MEKTKKNKLNIQNNVPSQGVLFLYGDVYESSWDDEDITPNMVMDAVSSLGEIDVLKIHLNSNGGDVFAGIAIYNYLKNLKCKVEIYVDALAASIASVIAMAASPGCLYMYSNTMMMVHEPWTYAIGNSNDLRIIADKLDNVSNSMVLETYAKRCSIEKDKIAEHMQSEKWLSAKDCLEFGYCDEIIDKESSVNAQKTRMIKNFKNKPQDLIFNTDTDLQKNIEERINQLDLI